MPAITMHFPFTEKVHNKLAEELELSEQVKLALPSPEDVIGCYEKTTRTVLEDFRTIVLEILAIPQMAPTSSHEHNGPINRNTETLKEMLFALETLKKGSVNLAVPDRTTVKENAVYIAEKKYESILRSALGCISTNAAPPRDIKPVVDIIRERSTMPRMLGRASVSHLRVVGVPRGMEND
jgi:hypothetical protein